MVAPRAPVSATVTRGKSRAPLHFAETSGAPAPPRSPGRALLTQPMVSCPCCCQALPSVLVCLTFLSQACVPTAEQRQGLHPALIWKR